MSPTAAALQTKQKRLRLRLMKHHLPLGVLTVLCAAALYLTRPYRDVISKASFATAYPALALLAATLLIGPLNLLRRRPNPVSSDLRRDVGIWAGILCVLHAVIGQCVHLRGRPWLYYVYGPAEHHHSFPVRHDLFGLANYTGAVGTLLLIALLATSNDYSLRALGTPRWKQLQRWNYAVFALTAVHAAGYLAIEKQKASFVAIVALCLAIALLFQAAGWVRRMKSLAIKA
ncbi:MAG: ferric reductase-like transmembrane domain-containing protein [Acidobacteriota bacterium]|nr:ferric reductase-like transmembrane domain-containing protein [Acidobacteriota bacterium]